MDDGPDRDPSGASAERISEGHDPILEAVEALKLRGHTVEPWGDNLLWLVDGQSGRSY
jgi:hypothetical protein